ATAPGAAWLYRSRGPVWSRAPRRGITPRRPVEPPSARPLRRCRRRLCDSFRATPADHGSGGHDPAALRRARAHLRHRDADNGGAIQSGGEYVTCGIDVRLAADAVVLV